MVLTLNLSRRAISRVEYPWASSRNTSSWRGLSRSDGWQESKGRGRVELGEGMVRQHHVGSEIAYGTHERVFGVSALGDGIEASMTELKRHELRVGRAVLQQENAQGWLAHGAARLVNDATSDYRGMPDARETSLRMDVATAALRAA